MKLVVGAFSVIVQLYRWIFCSSIFIMQVLSGIITSLGAGALFTVTKVFPTLLLLMGQDATYWLLGAIAMTSNIFFHFCVPETKGKSLLEIQQMFSKK